MGYVFDYKDSEAYNEWVCAFRQGHVGKSFKSFIQNLLKPEKNSRVIDIGCGSGINLDQIITGKKIYGTGIDPSQYMLDAAREMLGNRADLHKAFAEDLPFEDNSFDYSCIINTLEFVNNPAKVIEEAARVSRRKLLICVHNRYGTNGFENQLRSRLSGAAWENITFFNIWELKHLIKTIIGNVPVHWRSMAFFPTRSGFFANQFEKIRIFHRLPFGCFTGVVADLNPTYKTRPLFFSYFDLDKKAYINAEQLTSTAERKKICKH